MRDHPNLPSGWDNEIVKIVLLSLSLPIKILLSPQGSTHLFPKKLFPMPSALCLIVICEIYHSLHYYWPARAHVCVLTYFPCHSYKHFRQKWGYEYVSLAQQIVSHVLFIVGPQDLAQCLIHKRCQENIDNNQNSKRV